MTKKTFYKLDNALNIIAPITELYVHLKLNVIIENSFSWPRNHDSIFLLSQVFVYKPVIASFHCRLFTGYDERGIFGLAKES